MSHEVLERFGTDGSGPVFIKNTKGHSDHIFIVDGVHLVRHHIAKLGKLYHTRPVRVVLRQGYRCLIIIEDFPHLIN